MFAALHVIRAIIQTAGLVMHFITIPGSFFHELAHQLACYLVGHRVLEVRYIVRDNPAYAGYVLHQGPPGVARHLFIGIAPLLMGFAIWAVTLGLGWFLDTRRAPSPTGRPASCWWRAWMNGGGNLRRIAQPGGHGRRFQTAVQPAHHTPAI